MITLRLLFLAFTLFAFCNDSAAQSFTSGCVVDSIGRALPSVVVKVYAQQGSKMSTFTLTKKDGTYRLDLKRSGFPSE